MADDFNNFNKLLIYAIENNTSVEILEYIIQARTDKNLNFGFIVDNKFKNPIFEAVKNNYFDKADILIKNNANINCTTTITNNINIFEYLYYNKFLTVRNLKYILNRGFHFNDINIYIDELINNGDSQFLEIICNNIILYNNHNSN